MQINLYFIGGEDIGFFQAAQSCFKPVLLSELSPIQQEAISEELVFFDVFDENTCSKTPTRHAVVNLNNIPADIELTVLPVRELISTCTKFDIYNIFKAMQVLRWHQDHSFCSRCGSRTSSHRYELAKVCNHCQYRQYPRLQPCVIVIITREVVDEVTGKHKQQILLAKDRRFKRDMHSVIAGFVEVGETLEQAVKREVYEETSLEVDEINYLGSQPWPFPSNIMIAFHAKYKSGDLNIDTDELVHADFYDPESLPNIPPKGSISYEMIKHICEDKAWEL